MMEERKCPAVSSVESVLCLRKLKESVESACAMNVQLGTHYSIAYPLSEPSFPTVDEKH